jgi:small subunit ribosomal protein S8
VSTPGRRIYAGYRDVGWVQSGMGISIVTTPKGLMTDRKARRMKLGGEVLCHIW